ncbi:MAG: choice-of-anchor D domain-containing protein [Bdellovibrionaceae bacterium]|nr:choice-of-anchor D domain-containing protein [Pseudobdellovibrionaceae bacterium]
MFRSFISFAALSLMAVSASAALQASPSWINFGQVQVGTILGSSRTLMVRNAGPDAASVSVTNFGCFDFTVQNTSCWAVLPPGGACLMQVSFRPRMPGYKSCQIRINDQTGMGTSVSLSGTGVKR